MELEWMKRQLSEYGQLRNLEARIESLRSILTRCTAQLNGMPSGSDGSDKMAAMVAEIADLMVVMDARRIRIEGARTKIENALDKLPAQQQRVMYLRYIEGRSWNRISRELHYTRSHLMRIHKAALDRLHKE